MYAPMDCESCVRWHLFVMGLVHRLSLCGPVHETSIRCGAIIPIIIRRRCLTTWSGLCVKAVQVAEEYSVTLAIEGGCALTPIHSAPVYRRLLDEVGSPLLKIKLDVGNIYQEGELPRHREILDEDFALLGEDIVIVDAKDNDRDGWCGSRVPGQGLLDYDHVLSLVNKLGWDVPVMMDGHTENMAEFEESIAFVRENMQAINP